MEKDGGNSHHSRVGHFLRSMRVGIFGTLFVSRSDCAARVRAARVRAARVRAARVRAARVLAARDLNGPRNPTL
jgi:hypothetical protein